MDVVNKYLSTLVGRMQDGKEAKRELIKLARKSPDEVLLFLGRLSRSEQQYLKWLPAIAEESSKLTQEVH
jgi:hypothetical protein